MVDPRGRSNPSAAVGTSDTPVQRSKTGCQQCRRRKRKCDERHPLCTGCVERSLPCQWTRETPSCPRIATRRSRYNKDFAVPQEMRSLTTIFSLPTISVKERLLSHFLAYSPLWLTVGGDVRRSTLFSLVMPVVERSPLVLDCVLALSAGDLSKYESTSSDLASVANCFYGQALSGVRLALSRESISADSVEPSPCAGKHFRHCSLCVRDPHPLAYRRRYSDGCSTSLCA